MSANRDRCARGRLRKAIRRDLDRCVEIRESVCENRVDDPYEVFIKIGGQVIDEGLCWVSEKAGDVQGFAAYKPKTGYIELLYIHHLAQGQGIGTHCCGSAVTICAGLATMRPY